MMVEVLLRLDESGLPVEYSNLSSYVTRARARPAFKRAWPHPNSAIRAKARGLWWYFQRKSDGLKSTLNAVIKNLASFREAWIAGCRSPPAEYASLALT
jgi:hypothetical protein